MAEHTHFGAVCRVGCHHLAEGLAKRGHEITYLSTYLTPLHFFFYFTRRRKAIKERMANWRSNGMMSASGIDSYVPFTLIPYCRTPFFDSLTAAYRQFRWTFPPLSSRLKSPYDALLMGDPRFLPLVDEIDAPIKILRLTDDPLSSSGSLRSLELLLKEGLFKCTHVIVTAQKISHFLEKNFEYRKAIYMPNGVDLDHFIIHPKGSEPSDLFSIPQPRAIYVGAIDERLDLDLLKFSAAQLPSVSFVLIGPQYISLKPLEKIPNIFILGSRPYEELPNYLSSSRVALIPFKKNRRTDSICSIKLMQYLAAGLPTIATRLEELESQGAPVDLAETASEFSDSIQKNLGANGDPERFRSYAAHFSWEKNLDFLETLLFERLFANV